MNIPRTNSFQSRLRYLLFFSFIRTQCTPSAIHYCSLSRSLRHSVAIYFPLTATTASNAPSSLARCWLSQVPKESCKWLNFQQKLFPSSKKKMEWNNEKNREHMCSSNMRWRAAPIAILISLPACRQGLLRCDAMMFRGDVHREAMAPAGDTFPERTTYFVQSFSHFHFRSPLLIILCWWCCCWFVVWWWYLPVVVWIWLLLLLLGYYRSAFWWDEVGRGGRRRERTDH